MINSSTHQPSENSAAIDIFSREFDNAVAFQEGKYIVTAHSIDPTTDEANGGGIVANFVNINDANACFDEIMGINPLFDPRLHRTNWQLNTNDIVRTSEETAIQARENAKRALASEKERQKND